ncbi:GIY-YIG nuclease family protein [Aequorivita sp. CIP111184]|uniref:GIY-YIG nuclease family protein n=1 Tax=Aequorivita sp. CIP111184 TaxID=2211356 RepID=UPI000DBBF7E3|nr:GIY-YIG nuclease family protein [Aequorivita sp. CIP111184]SRX54801.1 UvrABC system protein C [Aequorivita sp. CIP111184]
MKFSFISVTASSNNLATARIINLAVRTSEDEQCIAEFESYIKPQPRLSMTERTSLTIDYSRIKTAPPFCDIALEIIALVENGQTVFMDRFSERLFIKSFKQIGYSPGRATYILQQLFKNITGTKTFTIAVALQSLGLKYFANTPLEHSKAMEKIFFALIEISSGTSNGSDLLKEKPNLDTVDFSHLPKTPGVYFFRNKEGEVIYVGKAINILKRVRSHFTASNLFERELCAQTAFLDFEETGSETLALLLESHYITTLKPICNTNQKELIDPYVIRSKTDGRGILRLQLIQKSYADSENEFYYNRDSVLLKMKQVQQKFNLCRRFTGIERTAAKCSDPVFCKGICQGLEDKSIYNERVAAALKFIFDERPSYIIKLGGRHIFESAVVLVKNGIYQGFGFIENDANINSFRDIEGYIKRYSHNYFTSRIIDQFHRSNKKQEGTILKY